MAENSKIEWTDHTFNPWIGCAKVSPGCKNCYAETLMDQRYGRVKWGVNGTRSRTAPANWKQPLKWNREAERSGIRRRVFCASLADVFEDRPELVEWRADLFKLIDATPFLDWLLLTKRPENIGKMYAPMVLSDQKEWNRANNSLPSSGLRFPDPIPGVRRHNVWLGTSVENQATADERIPHLLKAAHLARFTFLSCEPLLGPVDLLGVKFAERGEHYVDVLRGGYWCKAPYLMGARSAAPGEERGGFVNHSDLQDQGLINWVIGGMESGPHARPGHPDNARSLRDQCAAAGVAFLWKQWGEYIHETTDLESEPTIYVNVDGHTATEAEAIADGGQWKGIWRVGKHAAGRLLDGVEHNGFPA